TNIIEANITIEKIKYKNYLEDIGEVIVIPAIELVILLCLTYKTVLDVELDAVLRWQNAYLNIFDSTLENEDKKITNQRRIIIENNFKKLIELAN
ncbi:MAG: hypothetical protein MUF87_17445, partial [Anaerolineae bacterium]|nr:hypothetical protein [Anaerolineae bacterium]